MLDALARLFNRPDATALALEPRLAVAALLVHLAAVDGSVTTGERLALKRALQEFYELSEPDVERLITEATHRDKEAVDFYRFTSALSALENDERLQIVRMMWQVVFADHKNHELEDNMVWRIAELIGVSARDRTILRNQMSRN